ncbi:hypothetical protein Hdeb2414_s0002g00075251 [Helianthus debilis subsp. tardiflorus]
MVCFFFLQKQLHTHITHIQEFSLLSLSTNTLSLSLQPPPPSLPPSQSSATTPPPSTCHHHNQ